MQGVHEIMKHPKLNSADVPTLKKLKVDFLFKSLVMCLLARSLPPIPTQTYRQHAPTAVKYTNYVCFYKDGNKYIQSLSVCSLLTGKTTAGINVYFHFFSMRQLIASILLRDKHVAKMTYIPTASNENPVSVF